MHVISFIHEVVNKYNKDALLLDYYQQSESQNHNVTLKIQASVGENISIIAQFSIQMIVLLFFFGKEDSTNNEFQIWCSNSFDMESEIANIDLTSFLTILGIFCSV